MHWTRFITQFISLFHFTPVIHWNMNDITWWLEITRYLGMQVAIIFNLFSFHTLLYKECYLLKLWNTASFPSSTLASHSLYSGKLFRSKNLSSGCFLCVVMLKEGNIYCSKGRTLNKSWTWILESLSVTNQKYSILQHLCS